MKTVNDILKSKGHDIWYVTPDTTVYDALKLMADKDIGAALVVHDGLLVGIFSERDYARKVMLQGKSSLETPVEEVMSTKVFYVTPEDSLEQCMGLMTDKHIRHLPVLAHGSAAIGVVSIGDVVKAIIDEQEYVIEQLEKYITGTGYGR